MREIRSFVRRSGRLNTSQRYGLNVLWADYGITLSTSNAGNAGEWLDFEKIFIKAQPIILEIGFGNGDNLLQMAKDNRQQNYLGIEVYAAGIGRLINRAHQLSLSNIKIINGDCVAVLKYYIKDLSLSGVQIFCPDPWPKKRHHKRRLIQVSFLELLADKLKSGGFLHILTDWQDYALHIKAQFAQSRLFKSSSADNISIYNKRPLTKFENRGIKLGHTIYDFLYQKG